MDWVIFNLLKKNKIKNPGSELNVCFYYTDVVRESRDESYVQHRVWFEKNIYPWV